MQIVFVFPMNWKPQPFLQKLWLLFGGLTGLLALIFCPIVAAQSHFTPVSSADIEAVDAVWVFTPGIKVSGDFRLDVSQMNSGTFPPRSPEARAPDTLDFGYELNIGLRSIAQRNLSINVDLEIRQGPLQDADLREDEASGGREADSQTAQVLARQAFLEYNSNPRSIVKMGKHAFNLGDRQGKVFSGILTGVSQDCTAGTWCYQLGAAKIGTHSADWLYYGSLDYDIFYEKNLDGSPAHRLNIGIFRILYTERDIPLGKFIGPTFKDAAALQRVKTAYDGGTPEQQENSRTLLQQVIDRQGRPLYYDALNQEYFGFLLNWEIASFSLRWDFISNQGNRQYHLEGNETPDFGANSNQFDSDGKVQKSVAGGASELEMSYQMGDHRIGFRGMLASGDLEQADPEDSGVNFLRPLNGYYEIVPGSYKGTKFYFNGAGSGLTGGTGLGHSINNTTLVGGWYDFAPDHAVNYQLGLFQLKRTQPVQNIAGKAVQDIGVEWDNTLFWTIDQYLKTEFELNLFQPGGAFNYNDNQTPLAKNELVVHLVARLFYAF